MGFIGKLIKVCIKLMIYAVIFTVIAWIFLGLSPKSTWDRFNRQVDKITSFITGSVRNVSSTASDMANVARYHLDQASDRIEGKDPYEGVSDRLMQGM